jgi:hypothetical protein
MFNTRRNAIYTANNRARKNPNISVAAELRKILGNDFDQAILEEYEERYGFPNGVDASGDGYVYLMKARGFHGILTPFIGRYKIGKSNSPQRRHSELNGQQAPCPIDCIKAIASNNMSATESALHRQFKRQRRHGEYFDFWVWQLPLLFAAYANHERQFKAGKKGKPSKPTFFLVVAFIAIALLGVTTFTAPKNAPTHQTQTK